MYWINFLHFYQPATMDNDKVIEAVEKSYLRIIKALLKNNSARFTFNIQGCLLEKMDQLGYQDLIKDISNLIKRGQIELTGTASHHPFLPLLPENEIKKQVELQKQLIKKYFGDYKTRGFFFPEMAYSQKAARLIKRLGYDWIILDEISGTGKLNNIDWEKKYLDQSSGLKIIFRQRENSNKYVPRLINGFLDEDKDDTIITATDAELYGLRHGDISGQFEKILKNKKIKTATISEFLTGIGSEEKINPVLSSWESTEEELAAKKPYALWQDKDNKIHNKLRELIKLAIKTVNKNPNDPQYEWANRHLRQGLASCTLWWASGKKLAFWDFISWSPDEVERGLNELIKSIRALDNADTREAKLKAEKLYLEIKKLIWEKHWKEHWRV